MKNFTSPISWLALTGVLGSCLYFVIAFFARPAGDDFCYGFYSLHFPYSEAFAMASEQINGRFSASALILLNYSAIQSSQLYPLLPLALLLLTIFSFSYFINSLSRTKNWGTSVAGGLLITALYLHDLPKISEAYFWWPGAISYTLPACLALIYGSYLTQLTRHSYTTRQLPGIGLLALLLISLWGFSEIILLYLLVFHALLLWVRWKKVPLYLYGMVLLNVLGIFWLFHSPGNQTRMEIIGMEPDIVKSTLYSGMQAARFQLTWLSDLPLWIASGIWLIWWQPKMFQLKLPKLIRSWGIWLIPSLLLFLAAFPAYWGTGILGQHRTINLAFFFFLTWWVLVLVLLQPRLQALTLSIRQRLGPQRLPILSLLLIILLLITGNGWQVMQDLTLGSAAHYATQSDSRGRALEENRRTDSLTLSAIDSPPPTLFVIDLQKGADHWLNGCYCQYYEIGKVKLKNTGQEKDQPVTHKSEE